MLNHVLEATLAFMILLLALSVSAIVRVGPATTATTESNTDSDAAAPQPARVMNTVPATALWQGPASNGLRPPPRPVVRRSADSSRPALGAGRAASRQAAAGLRALDLNAARKKDRSPGHHFVNHCVSPAVTIGKVGGRATLDVRVSQGQTATLARGPAVGRPALGIAGAPVRPG